MKTRHSLILSVLVAICFGGLSLTAQTILFHANFEDDSEGLPPALASAGGVWATFSHSGVPVPIGTVAVVKDSENLFGHGPDNQVLRYTSVRNSTLNARISDSTVEVVTLSFDFVGRNLEGDVRWLTMNIFGGTGIFNNNTRAHVLSLRLTNARIRGPSPEVPYGANDVKLRFDVIVNNSNETISYSAPGHGETFELAGGMASVWVDGVQLIDEYIFAPGVDGGGFIQGGGLNADSSANCSFDIDNYTFFEGAHVGVPFPAEVGPSDMGLRASITGGSVELSWNASIDSWYQVQYRTDLSEGAWTNLGDQIYPWEEGVQVFQDPESVSANEQRYYRVQRTLW